MIRIGSARIGETGGYKQVAGNQTGKELSVQDYYNHSKKWDVIRLKNKRSPNAGKGKKKYFLSGLIKCGECGAPIVVSHSYKNGLPAYFRLYCLNRKDNKNCNNPTRKMELAEEAVLNAIKNNILNRKIIKTLAEKACSLQENNTSNKLKALKDELKNIQ